MIDAPGLEREAYGQLARFHQEAGKMPDRPRNPPQSRQPLLPITDQRQRDKEDARDMEAKIRAKMNDAQKQSDRFSTMARMTEDR